MLPTLYFLSDVVIEWLHKQLNEEAMTKRPLGMSAGFPDFSSRVEYRRTATGGQENMGGNRYIPRSQSTLARSAYGKSTADAATMEPISSHMGMGSTSSVYTPQYPSSRAPLRSMSSDLNHSSVASKPSPMNAGVVDPIQQAIHKMNLSQQQQQQHVSGDAGLKSNYF